MSDKSLLEFAEKLSEILPFIIRELSRRQSNELFRGKITLPQFITLDYLSRREDFSMNEIARFLHVSRAAATGVVDRLVRDAYCLRYGDPNDRRVIKIKITHKGKELVKRIIQQRKEMVIQIFGKISRQEREEYLRILSKIRDILKSKL